MRVVVDEELTLEPGVLFRDGSGVDDDVEPDAANSSTNNGESLFNRSSDSLFGGNNNAGLEDINPGDLPAASVNDATNGAIELEVGIPLDGSGQIGGSSAGVFQVINDTNSDQDIAIRFDVFGSDANPDGTGNSGNNLSGQQVFDTFKFKDSSGTQISSSGYSSVPSSPDPTKQQVTTTTVSAGGNEQIYIDYDTATSSIKSAIETAAGSPSNPFTGQTVTVDLVDTLGVGVQ
jgi:hypothetical protein